MIKILGNIPDRVAVAVSGGPDSMAVLDFLRNNNRREVLALHFNHGTEHASEAEEFVLSYCEENKVPLVVGDLVRDKLKEESMEEFWRNGRYSFFSDYFRLGLHGTTQTYNIDYDSLAHFYYSATPIVTCHHLDDVSETWIFTALHGNPNLIPYKRDNFIRPFLSTEKKDLIEWADRKGVPYIIDPSNNDNKYMRNFIRNELIPKCKVVNPGIKKTLRKKVLSLYNDNLLSF